MEPFWSHFFYYFAGQHTILNCCFCCEYFGTECEHYVVQRQRNSYADQGQFLWASALQIKAWANHIEDNGGPVGCFSFSSPCNIWQRTHFYPFPCVIFPVPCVFCSPLSVHVHACVSVCVLWVWCSIHLRSLSQDDIALITSLRLFDRFIEQMFQPPQICIATSRNSYNSQASILHFHVVYCHITSVKRPLTSKYSKYYINKLGN